MMLRVALGYNAAQVGHRNVGELTTLWTPYERRSHCRRRGEQAFGRLEVFERIGFYEMPVPLDDLDLRTFLDA